MKRTIFLAIVLAVFALAAMSGVTFAQGPYGPNQGGYGMMGSGMMGGYGLGPSQTVTPTVPFGNVWGWGGMMGGGMMGGHGMMGNWGYSTPPGAIALTLDQAVNRIQDYVASLNNPDLKLVEVEEYTWNFYGVVQEKSTGINAFQVLANKTNGAVYPEMGPNMMWNTKYSPMGWMMGGSWFVSPSAKMTVSVEQARGNASEFLKKYSPNAALEDATDTFYGYYNIDVLQNGKTYGMLSVNGYTGSVWYHAWHGAFIAAKDLE